MFIFIYSVQEVTIINEETAGEQIPGISCIDHQKQRLIFFLHKKNRCKSKQLKILRKQDKRGPLSGVELKK
jgi:hypothetical protein